MMQCVAFDPDVSIILHALNYVCVSDSSPFDMVLRATCIQKIVSSRLLAYVSFDSFCVALFHYLEFIAYVLARYIDSLSEPDVKSGVMMVQCKVILRSC